MEAKRVFLAELPGDPVSDYLRAVLPLTASLADAGAAVLPALTEETAVFLTEALRAEKPVYLPAEALPEILTPALKAGLSALSRRGLIVCAMADLPRWVETGANCPVVLTLERLKTFAAQGTDRIYLAGVPAATPLARKTAKELSIDLTGGIHPGVGKSHRFSLVYPQK